ncbi:SpoIIE family protein phosphatase [Streptomyces sp. NPDC015131]|uniref:SpoIIE family protein phosphatase n=1 Tax=Streptomyces sp. NPDC015131 TaxID=3364941 RepID=UPI0036FE4743
MPIDHHSAVQVAAAQAGAMARACGLPGGLPDRAAVLASELASNIDKHARNGALYLQPAAVGRGMDIFGVDRGPGIRDLDQSFTDGYTTTNTLGAGLGAMRRIASHFTIRSGAGYGTLAHAWIADPRLPQEQPAAVGALSLPAHGRAECGDSHALVRHGETWTGLVLDGQGDGPEAAGAVQRAVRTFRPLADHGLPEIMTALDRALRHTSGAAAALVRTHADRAEYCVVGDIRVLALSPRGVEPEPAGRPGVVGHGMPPPRTGTVPWQADSVVLVHTGGVDHRWIRDASAVHLRLPPPLLVASLIHSHRRRRDDATALAFGASQGATCRVTPSAP